MIRSMIEEYDSDCVPIFPDFEGIPFSCTYFNANDHTTYLITVLVPPPVRPRNSYVVLVRICGFQVD